MRDTVSSIDTNGQCVLLWHKNRCKGYHTRIGPGTPYHNDLSQIFFDNKPDTNVDDNTRSISSCDGYILLYQDANFPGTSQRIHVGPCANFSNDMKNKVSSINTLGECVYLWSRSECQGSYARVAPGTRNHLNFDGMKFHDNNDRNLNDNTVSISRCSSWGKILTCGLWLYSIFYLELICLVLRINCRQYHPQMRRMPDDWRLDVCWLKFKILIRSWILIYKLLEENLLNWFRSGKVQLGLMFNAKIIHIDLKGKVSATWLIC